MFGTDHLVLDRGGAIKHAIEHAAAAITACTVAAYSGDGAEKLAATAATHPPLATTLTAGMERGARDCQVTALATGDLQPGDAFKVAQTDGRSQVFTCHELDVSGKRIYFAEESIADYALAAPVFGLVCRYTVAAAIADTVWWRGRAEWVATWSSAVQDSVTAALHCTRYRLPQRLVTQADLQRRYGRLERLLPLDASLERQIDDAQTRALDDLIRDGLPAHVLIPGERFKTLITLAWMLERRFMVAGGALDFAALDSEYHAERARVLSVVQRDSDQDGTFGETEQIRRRCFEVLG